ncbi:MAG: carbonic anhydrase [Microthrixaceae bacterium]
MGSSVPPTPPFAAAVTCIDGRTHAALVDWMRHHLGVDYVDLVTQPGADGALSECPRTVCDGIRDQVAVSVTAHASRTIVVAGHDDCAGNPVPADVHRRQILDGVAEIRSWGMDVEVLGVWIDRQGRVSRVLHPGDDRADLHS